MVSPVPIEEWENEASAMPTQEDALETRDFKRAFDSLSPDEQQILLLVGLESLSYQDVAKVLNVAVGTVKSRLFRARDRLRVIQQKMNNSSPEAA